jgi:hypothetical protein
MNQSQQLKRSKRANPDSQRQQKLKAGGEGLQAERPKKNQQQSMRSILRSAVLPTRAPDSPQSSASNSTSSSPPSPNNFSSPLTSKVPALTPLLRQLARLSLHDTSLAASLINASGLMQALEFTNKLYAQGEKILNATPKKRFEVQGRIGGWFQGRHGGVEAGISEAGVLFNDRIDEAVREALKTFGDVVGEEHGANDKAGNLQGLRSMQVDWEAPVPEPDLPFLKGQPRTRKRARQVKQVERGEAMFWQWLGEILNDMGADGWPSQGEVEAEAMDEDVATNGVDEDGNGSKVDDNENHKAVPKCDGVASLDALPDPPSSLFGEAMMTQTTPGSAQGGDYETTRASEEVLSMTEDELERLFGGPFNAMRSS